MPVKLPLIAYPSLIRGLRDSAPDLRQARMRYLARTDLYFLLRFVLNRKDVENPWLFSRIREVEASPNNNLDLWAREHYKSTILTFALTIQDLLRGYGEGREELKAAYAAEQSPELGQAAAQHAREETDPTQYPSIGKGEISPESGSQSATGRHISQSDEDLTRGGMPTIDNVAPSVQPPTPLSHNFPHSISSSYEGPQERVNDLAFSGNESQDSRGYIRGLDENGDLPYKNFYNSENAPRLFDEPRIAIFSQSRPLAKDFLRQIMRELEGNELLKALFPDILWGDPKKESPKWSEDDGIVLKRESNPRESSVEAWGLVDGQPTGKHFNILVYDDVVTVRSVTTSEMIRKTTEAVEMSYNLGTDGGVRRFVGTVYDDQDTYQVLRTRETATPRIYPATHDGSATGRPVFMSPEFLSQKLRDMGPYTFSTQMLLDPVPKEDAMFSRGDFLIEDRVPELNLYLCSDFAVQSGLDGGQDWTEHGIFGVDCEGNPWVIDWWSGQVPSDVWIDAGLDLVRDHPVFYWVGESGQIRRSVEPYLVKRMMERSQERSSRYVSVQWLPPIGKKEMRILPFHGLVKQKGLRLLRAPWNVDLINEMVRFPRSQRDHKVDACSLFGRALLQTWAAQLPQEGESPQIIRDYGFGEPEALSWKTV